MVKYDETVIHGYFKILYRKFVLYVSIFFL